MFGAVSVLQKIVAQKEFTLRNPSLQACEGPTLFALPLQNTVTLLRDRNPEEAETAAASHDQRAPSLRANTQLAYICIASCARSADRRRYFSLQFTKGSAQTT